MRLSQFSLVIEVLLLFGVGQDPLLAQSTEEKVDYLREVRPILAEHCLRCHGHDEGARQAGLRLDQSHESVGKLESGNTAIVPGRPDASELIKRISSHTIETRMPPVLSGPALSTQQIATLHRWIAEGAPYAKHWSFGPVPRPELPSVQNVAWVRNPIDRFVLARLEREEIAPSPEADRSTLLRRLSLDLLGLPPTPEQLAKFQADTSPDAYERLVDQVLASPHFGERWGRHWLDLARYADSDGYLNDDLRPYAWLYRDWVIDATNRDMPFDQFTIEQLAGDLLPEATLPQRIATGFLRNSLRNIEAGVDREEYRLKEIADRVSTVGIAWLGLTVGCAECHSHKYDPISQQEFYELFAFFNDADDVDIPAVGRSERQFYKRQKRAWSKEESKLAGELKAQLAEEQARSGEVDCSSLLKALATVAKSRTADQKNLIRKVANIAEPLRESIETYERHATKKPQSPQTKAMTVAPRELLRNTYVHRRGNYRDRGEEAFPGTPAVFPALQSRAERADRLDLARWLVDRENPLTARVTVNHIWNHLFGEGLVRTVDNFGTGGELPSHPELLNWLASEFMERKWSRKQIIRMLVTSATYRQASRLRKDLLQRDPTNILLARQARWRLEAESVRDTALASSGLLERRIGGPGIRPPQPAYVTSISRNVDWEVSSGPDLYRRGMYIQFRRATPYPMLMTFDAPDSTVTCARRERTNSPLQALTLLNDKVFFECAQALGRDLAASTKRSVEERLREGIQRCLTREPRPGELDRLEKLYQEERAYLSSNPAAVQAILNEHVATDDSVDEATWILVSRVLMNLDEFITRE